MNRIDAENIVAFIWGKSLNKQKLVKKLITDTFEYGHCRPVWHAGSGNFISTVDRKKDVCKELEKFCFRFSIENDAPRGGKQGTKIILL